YKDLVQNQIPKVNNNNIMLIARNEAESAALKKRLEKPFRAFCKKIGASNYLLDITVKTEEIDIQKFREKTALEDQQLVIKTVQEKKKRNKEKAKKDSKTKNKIHGNKINNEPFKIEEIKD